MTTPFRPARRRRLHEDIAEQLRDAILDGRFRSGERLPPERELAEEFRANRTSIREAIKVLEGLGLVSVRQGDGATVQPLVEASFDVLAPMIFHDGRIDADLVTELAEVMTPLLFEMARLAIERRRPAQLERLRRLHEAIADDRREREQRFASARDVLVLLSDMTGNRVWQMLARRMRTLLASPPLQETRRRLRRDPARIAEIMAACLIAIDAGRPHDAIAALRRFITFVGDPGLQPRPRAAPARHETQQRIRSHRQSNREEYTDERVHADNFDPGTRPADGDVDRLPMELRARGRRVAPALREGR